MENKINWDREDYWNEFNTYDEYFLSFHYDHCQVDEDLWKELVKKWKLNTKVIVGDSRYDPEGEDVSVYNDDYSIVITGINYDEMPGYYLILTFNKKIGMEIQNRFFRDFKDSLDHYSDEVVRPGITGEYTSHPKEIVKIMIDRL